MFDFQLPIFPIESTAITMTTTVWIGVLITVFFNLRIGWTLSGLVVPGYLAPLLVTRPMTAGIILLEAILTYLIIRVVSESKRFSPYWSSFFGRDRFFAIVVVSVLVRVLLDGWLLPALGSYLVETWNINFDYRDSLQSFGLIVVALIANYFWKPGLCRGIGPLLCCVGLTYLFVNFVLVTVTNFNLGNLHMLYEDISSSLMASPKAYMIVITTAWLASWINLKYSWDFNGILIPALLGLLWYEPSKIVLSCFECLLIYGLATQILRLSFFQNTTMEGGRKLLFFFTICFSYRMVLSHCLPLFSIHYSVTDSFGYGYLLTTLMAIKAYDKKLAVRMMKATLQVSLVGAVAGSMIGFAFFCGPDIQFYSRPLMAEDPNAQSVIYESKSIFDVIRRDKIILYEKQTPESYVAPHLAEIKTFRSALESLKEIDCDESSRLREVNRQLAAVNYQLSVVDNRYFYLCENQPANGWGIYIIDKEKPNGLCVEVPCPLDESTTIESGMCLLSKFDCSALAIAGAPQNVNVGGSANVNQIRETMFGVFHRAFGKEQPIVIRGYEADNLTRYQPEKQVDMRTGDNELLSQLWISGSVPPSLNLARLRKYTDSIDIRWNESPVESVLRNPANDRFAELVLSKNSRRRLIAHTLVSDTHQASPKSELATRECHIASWLLKQKERIIQQGTNQFVSATTAEMLYFDQEVLTPLMDVIQQIRETNPNLFRSTPFWTHPRFQSHLTAIDVTARVLGYQLLIVHDQDTNKEWVALTELESAEPRGWGTYVFRPHQVSPYSIEIPRPLYEFRSFDFGVNLFERTEAASLLIAGAHPRANHDGTSDISKAINRTNLFNLVRHVQFRDFDNRPLLVVQARAIQAPVTADVVIASDDGSRTIQQLSELKRGFVDSLTQDQLTIQFVDGSESTAGYEIGLVMQATAVQVSQNKEVLSLWLSPTLRAKFRSQTEYDNQTAQFEACGLTTTYKSLNAYLKEAYQGAIKPDSISTPIELVDLIKSYTQSNDVIRLFEFTQRYPDWDFERIVDSASGQAFLLVAKDGSIPDVFNLSGFVSESREKMNGYSSLAIESFVRKRALWLETIQ